MCGAGSELCPAVPGNKRQLYRFVGVGKTIGVGDNLQEDVHAVKNGCDSWVLAVVASDLMVGGGKGRTSAVLVTTDTFTGLLWDHCFWEGKVQPPVASEQSPPHHPALPFWQTRPHWPA